MPVGDKQVAEAGIAQCANEAMAGGKVAQRLTVERKRRAHQTRRARRRGGKVAQAYGLELEREAMRGRPLRRWRQLSLQSDRETSELFGKIRRHLACRGCK